eukprot:SAG31_NODE_13152_length_889_cov_1.834177_1_plen_188_part_01
MWQTLPFTRPAGSEKRPVVVVGGSANSTRLLGGGHYARRLQPGEHYPSIPDAIESLLKDSGTRVEWHPGMACKSSPYGICAIPAADSELQAAAVQAATQAVQVVIVVNLQGVAPCDSDAAFEAGGEFNACGFEGEQHDRSHITLPKHQQNLALAVLRATNAAKVPAVVVLVHGGGLAIEEIKEAAPAI